MPVIEDYLAKMPFEFTGTLETLTIELKPTERPRARRGGERTRHRAIRTER
jgi:hypothetical protein